MEKLRQFVDKLLVIWSTLEGWQKLSILFAICGVFVLLVLVIALGSSPSYERIFSNLEISDQAKITDHLRENKIPYRLDTMLNAISVPKDRAADVRLGLAKAGLPSGGSTFTYEDIFKIKTGTPENQRQKIILLALEGELARTLKRLDIVEDAKVHIVIPEPRLFPKVQDPSSASVILKLRPGFRMNPQQVKAVVNLVAGSVAKLPTEKITVVDTLGNDLTKMIDDESNPTDKISFFRDLERKHEKHLEEKIREILSASFGPTKFVATVRVELDFDKRSSSLKEFIPGGTDKGVPRSTHTTEETFTGKGEPSGGVPGTTTNVPGYAISPSTSISDYAKTEGIINYEITSRVSEEIITPGGIKRITAAVLIDGELEEQQRNDIRKLVSSSIGINESRGDTIDVQARTFIPIIVDQTKGLTPTAIAALIGLVLLLILGAVLVFLWYRKRNAMLEMNKTLQETRHIPTIQEMLTTPDFIASQGEIQVLEEQIKAYARSNPKEVANLVNEWLSED
jgi:flagellar M-ring protein FliF